jgi:hypothetical protein
MSGAVSSSRPMETVLPVMAASEPVMAVPSEVPPVIFRRLIAASARE